MAHRLDVLMKAHRLTNEQVAEDVECSVNYISGIRNGQKPGLKLGTALCRRFPGELTLDDLGIEIDRDLTVPASDAPATDGDGKPA
jgi:hypothetical protein